MGVSVCAAISGGENNYERGARRAFRVHVSLFTRLPGIGGQRQTAISMA